VREEEGDPGKCSSRMDGGLEYCVQRRRNRGNNKSFFLH